MRVSELMQSEVQDTVPSEMLADAAASMRDHGIGCLAVTEGEELTGIITERDLMRAIAEGSDPQVTTVERYMSAVPVVTGPDTDVATAARIMAEHDIRHLPIVSGGRLVGIVSARDLLVLEAWPR